MTSVRCDIIDVSGRPVAGTLYVRPITYTPDGDALIAPEAVRFDIPKGGSSVSLATGPARIVIETQKSRRGADIVVPPSGPVSLSSLIGA